MLCDYIAAWYLKGRATILKSSLLSIRWPGSVSFKGTGCCLMLLSFQTCSLSAHPIPQTVPTSGLYLAGANLTGQTILRTQRKNAKIMKATPQKATRTNYTSSQWRRLKSCTHCTYFTLGRLWRKTDSAGTIVTSVGLPVRNPRNQVEKLRRRQASGSKF